MVPLAPYLPWESLMRFRRRWPLILLALLGFLALGDFLEPVPAAEEEETEQPRLVVLVVFDQMRGDYLTRWQKEYSPEGFGRLQRDGAWFQNCHYPYAYTLTAPGHTTLVTGCPPHKHGIIANSWYDRAGGEVVSAVRSERYLPVPAPRGGLRVPGSAPVRRRS